VTPEEVPAFLAAIQARVATAAPGCAMAMGEAHRDRMRDNELIRYPHAAGTKTPSPPGEPPGLISGALRGSVTCVRGPGGGMVASSLTGPHVVYASIQEYGGKVPNWRHRGWHSLPARPYVRPSRDAVIANGSAVSAANAAFMWHVWG
jgi:phage gpG-like protein